MALHVEGRGFRIDLTATDPKKREAISVDYGLPGEEMTFIGYEEGMGGAAYSRKPGQVVEVAAGETKTIIDPVTQEEFTMLGSD